MYIYTLSSLFFYLSYHGIERNIAKKNTNKLLENDESSNNKSSILTTEYRIVNVVKSTALLYLTFPGTRFLYRLAFSPEILEISEMNTVGAIYVATDLSALFYNYNCHRSTMIHHIVVQFFYLYCYYWNFTMTNPIVKGIGIYCILSAYAGVVNLRLALRNAPFDKERKIEYAVNEISLFVYITVSVINWIVQSYLLIQAIRMQMIASIFYCGTLSLTIYDDLFLIKYLRNYK